MAEVESVVFTTETKKTRKVKKSSKRRESTDQNAEVTITELDSTTNNQNNNAIEEYVLAGTIISYLFIINYLNLNKNLSIIY